MKQFWTLFSAFIFLVNPAICAEIFTCTPHKIIFVNADKTEEKMLSQKEASEFKCTIEAKNNKYYWSSHNNAALYKTRNDKYTTFINHKGRGYIKIGESLDMNYTEHIVDGLSSINLYGNCKEH